MVGVIRVVLIALMLHLLVPGGAGAKEASCRLALDRCIAQCDRFPGILSNGCSAGCVLGYLTCD